MDRNPPENHKALKIAGIRADTVMCDFSGCAQVAEFLVRYPSGAVRAVCEGHMTLIRERQLED